MTYLFVAVVCLSFGWFLGVCAVTSGLRRQLDDLEVRGAELDRDRAQLDLDRRQAVEYAEALLQVEPRVVFDLRTKRRVGIA